jgi:hypothetical protein
VFSDLGIWVSSCKESVKASFLLGGVGAKLSGGLLNFLINLLDGGFRIKVHFLLD